MLHAYHDAVYMMYIIPMGCIKLGCTSMIVLTFSFARCSLNNARNSAAYFTSNDCSDDRRVRCRDARAAFCSACCDCNDAITNCVPSDDDDDDDDDNDNDDDDDDDDDDVDDSGDDDDFGWMEVTSAICFASLLSNDFSFVV